MASTTGVWIIIKLGDAIGDYYLGGVRMLKYMDVVVEYKVCVCKTVVAEDNEDNGEYGYDTQRQRVEDEVCELVNPIVLSIKEKFPKNKNWGFEWEVDSTIEEQ